MQPINRPGSRAYVLDTVFRTQIPSINQDIVKLINDYDGCDISRATTDILAQGDPDTFFKSSKFKLIVAEAARALSTSSDECDPKDKRDILFNFCRSYYKPADEITTFASSASRPLFAEMRKLKLTINLDRTDLSFLTFWQCDLKGMSAIGANLTRTRFCQSDLSSADLSSSICDPVKFDNCDLRKINFTDAQLIKLYFYGSTTRDLICSDERLNAYLKKYQADHWITSRLTGIYLEGTFSSDKGMQPEVPF